MEQSASFFSLNFDQSLTRDQVHIFLNFPFDLCQISDHLKTSKYSRILKIDSKLIYPVLGPIRVECAISSKRRLLNPHLYSHPTSGIQSEITLLSYSPSNPSRDSFTLLHRFTNLEQMEPMSFVIYYQKYIHFTINVSQSCNRPYPKNVCLKKL